MNEIRENNAFTTDAAPEIQSVSQYLATASLAIPDYQRPYEWTSKNVTTLLEDIQDAIETAGNYATQSHDSFRYRIGTMILHINSEARNMDIVDGQQRTISLLLLRHFLNTATTTNSDNGQCDLPEWRFSSNESKKNIYNNYKCICGFFNGMGVDNRKSIIEKFKSAFNDLLQVVVIRVKNLSEAFQLFDSQNSRGKPLEPHDLLKAYHLREMRSTPHEMRHAVEKWENFERAEKTSAISKLFRSYLFPIWNWSKGERTREFNENEIDVFKGVPEYSTYSFARRIQRAMPLFQLGEPFVSGADFFEMVEYYQNMQRDIDTEIGDNFSDLRKIMHDPEYTGTGFICACLLFKQALLCYYDRFRNFNPQAVRKLFVWAFMLRIDMIKLGEDSVNLYAIEKFPSGRYTNSLPMFALIKNARRDREISNLPVTVPSKCRKGNEKWTPLLAILRGMLNLETNNG